MSQKLDYSSLVDSYYESLYTTLRKFKAGPDFLESWVHDEDHTQSILGIFEAAQSYGIEDLTLVISQEVYNSLNKVWLEKEISKIGEITFKTEQNMIEVSVEFKQQNIFGKVHPCYQKSLETASKQISNEGEFSDTEKSGFQYVSSTIDGMTLHILVDEKGIVHKAKHSNAKDCNRIVLDKLCEVLVNRPLQEGSEHGVLRLEFLMRSKSVTPPVLGLVTPTNADPIFKTPLALVRACYSTLLKEKRISEIWNNWEDPTSVDWVNLSDEAKIQAVQMALLESSRTNQLPYNDLDVLLIKHNTRVVLMRKSYSGSFIFGKHLMLLEKELKARLNPSLELVLESLEDKNNREKRTKRDAMTDARPQI